MPASSLQDAGASSVRHRLDPFRETGRVSRMTNELFAENCWIRVMLGQGIEPQPVAQLPVHQTFVDQYCKAHSK
jgi:hypothetical protein